MSSIERRAFLRYKISLPVRLSNKYGAFFNSVTREISLGGMQVICDATMLHQMLPNGIQTAPGDRVFLQAELKFPDSSESVLLNSHVQGVLRMTESEYFVRFLFIDIDQLQQDQLQRLLNQ